MESRGYSHGWWLVIPWANSTKKGACCNRFYRSPCPYIGLEPHEEHHLTGMYVIPLGWTPRVSTSGNDFGDLEVHNCANVVAALPIL